MLKRKKSHAKTQRKQNKGAPGFFLPTRMCKAVIRSAAKSFVAAAKSCDPLGIVTDFRFLAFSSFLCVLA
jgi:hypothetical protein